MFIYLCPRKVKVVKFEVNTCSYLTIVMEAQPLFLSYKQRCLWCLARPLVFV